MTPDLLAFAYHEYFVCMYGLIGWFLMDWSYCVSNKKWSSKRWWAESKDEFIVGIWLAPLIVVFDDEIIDIISYFKAAPSIFESTTFHELFYLSAGPLVEALYKIRHLIKKKTSI